MKTIQIIEISLDELIEQITESIDRKLNEITINNQPSSLPKYLNRQELAELLQVDVSTIHNWRKEGKITAYGIGGKRLYKREEIEQALVQIEER